MKNNCFLDAWGIETTLPLSDLQKTAVKFWAFSLLQHSAMTTTRLAKKYLPISASGRPSTLFNQWQSNGTPLPKLTQVNGDFGPLHAIERDWPGSLKILMHPGWALLARPLSIHSVYDVVLHLEPSVRSVLMEQLSCDAIQFSEVLYGDGFYRTNYFGKSDLSEANQLVDIGNIDAFFAVVALYLEAEKTHQGVLATALSYFLESSNWRCFVGIKSNLSTQLAQHISDLVQTFAEAQSTCSSLHQVAKSVLSIEGRIKHPKQKTQLVDWIENALIVQSFENKLANYSDANGSR
jgi:hypothetical protein